MAKSTTKSEKRYNYTVRDLLLGLIIPAVTFIVASVGIVLQVASHAATNEQQTVPPAPTTDIK